MTKATTNTDKAQAQTDASNEASAQRAADATPLDQRLQEAQAKGYVGQDAADVRASDGDGIALEGITTADLSGPGYGGTGIDGLPGGHPNDPTVGSVVGADGSTTTSK